MTSSVIYIYIYGVVGDAPNDAVKVLNDAVKVLDDVINVLDDVINVLDQWRHHTWVSPVELAAHESPAASWKTISIKNKAD